MPRPILLLALLTILSLATLSLAASATSFCKCACFGNSTIIQLDGLPASSPATSRAKSPLLAGAKDGSGKGGKGSGGAGGLADSAKAGHGTCNDCNKKFCLDYNLPICKEATEENVFTTCFQRDSAKDEAVVFIFIAATVGLLAWSVVKPWAEKWIDKAKDRRTYEPVSHNGADES